MTHRSHLIAGVLLSCALTAPVSAQNRVDQQVFLEIRTLQNNVQRLQLAVNAVTEQLKKSDGRIDAQVAASAKGFADQKGQIDAIAAGLRALNERENEGSVRVLQLTQEMQAIRKGLAQQQSVLNDILALLQQPAVPVIDPAASAANPPGTPRPGAPALPPSPGAYYKTAFDYWYKGDFENAIQVLGAAIEKFPDFPDAARAQLTIGESHAQLGKSAEALAAFALVIEKYKDPDVVPDAYLKQGLLHERLGQKDLARKPLEEVRKLYPDSTAAIQALAALKRLGFIK